MVTAGLKCAPETPANAKTPMMTATPNARPTVRVPLLPRAAEQGGPDADENQDERAGRLRREARDEARTGEVS